MYVLVGRIDACRLDWLWLWLGRRGWELGVGSWTGVMGVLLYHVGLG
jgi:hypothetical protein